MFPDYKTIDNYSQDVTLSSDVRSEDSGDLKYLNNKVLFVRKNGGYFVTDNKKLRLIRLNKKFKKWEDVVREKSSLMPIIAFQIGLSYKPGESWRGHDITGYIKNVGDYVGLENLLAYAWVAEMQKREEVHYHAMIVTKVGCRLVPMPDKKGHWKHGSSSRKIVGDVEVGYLTSDYMRKKEQKSNYPKGIRTHETWLSGKYFGEMEYWALRSASYPSWLVDNINNAGLINPKIIRAPGGGWLVKAIGGIREYFWKNDEGVILTGKEAEDFLKMEKYKYPMPF